MKKIVKQSLFKNDFTYRLFMPLMQFYVINVRTMVTDIHSLFNYYVLRLDNGPKKIELPKMLFVNPTNFCNAKCGFCAYRKVGDQFKNLDLGSYRKVIDQYAALGGKKISLTPTIGEVLLDPTIYEKIAYAKQKGMYVSIVSNGVLINNNDNYRKLLDADVDELIFSIGDIVPKYEAIVFGIPEAVSKNKMEGLLKMLAEMDRRKPDYKIRLAFRPMRRYDQIMGDLKKSEFWQYYEKGLFDTEFLVGYDNWGGRIAQQELAGIQKLKRPHQVKKYPCHNLYTLSILGSGDVRLCGCRVKNTIYDELVIGNINQTPLEEIMKSKKWTEIISEFGKGNLPEVCKGCSFYAPRYR